MKKVPRPSKYVGTMPQEPRAPTPESFPTRTISSFEIGDPFWQGGYGERQTMTVPISYYTESKDWLAVRVELIALWRQTALKYGFTPVEVVEFSQNAVGMSVRYTTTVTGYVQ